MVEFETLQDAANANTPESLDYYWANVDYDLYFNAGRMAQYHEVIHYVYDNIYNRDSSQRIIVLDAGCGPGYFLREFEREFIHSHPTGIDYAVSAIEHAVAMNTRSWIYYEDLTKPDLGYRADLVFCLQTLEHIEQWQIALDNLVNMTKPGGHLIITIPNGEFDNLPQHVNRWTLDEFHEILKPYGKVTVHYLGYNSRILAHVQKGE